MCAEDCEVSDLPPTTTGKGAPTQPPKGVAPGARHRPAAATTLSFQLRLPLTHAPTSHEAQCGNRRKQHHQPRTSALREADLFHTHTNGENRRDGNRWR